MAKGDTSQQNSFQGGQVIGGIRQKPSSKKPLSFKQAYPAAVEQTGEDYGNIMKGYQDVLNKGPNTGLMGKYEQILNNPSSASKFSPVTAEQQNYTRDPNVTKSLGMLEELGQTGGYSEQGIADLRARGVSPIRSVYANAMRNMDRGKSLSGGYSPGGPAASARMARELSEQVAGATQNVNADIAGRVAQGRQQMAPQFAQFAAGESGVQKGIEGSNVAARNDMARFNAQGERDASRFGADERMQALGGLERLQNPSNQLAALSGMQSLYGTTPALANTFGNQATQAAQLQQQSTGQNQAAGSNMISSYVNRNKNRPPDPWGRW